MYHDKVIDKYNQPPTAPDFWQLLCIEIKPKNQFSSLLKSGQTKARLTQYPLNYPCNYLDVGDIEMRITMILGFLTLFVACKKKTETSLKQFENSKNICLSIENYTKRILSDDPAKDG
ncbi:MAG: hypothetical protein NTV34_02640, partial [Proteobacteria bacterium]|nr:hypothetical protein [Pseudomonadota bacterium]